MRRSVRSVILLLLLTAHECLSCATCGGNAQPDADAQNLYGDFEATASSGSRNMETAYDLSSTLLRDRLKVEDRKILDAVKNDDIVVVSGDYDHIHLVLSAMNVPFRAVDRHEVSTLQLRPQQIVFVNCVGHFPPEGVRNLVRFVESGGLLITTDWALKHVIEVGFPGTVEFNGRQTSDTVVPITVLDPSDEVVKGFLVEQGDSAPQWWLETSSYPIHVVNNSIVKVLIKSNELKEQFGEEAVIVRFDWGKGQVYHMISHFYLQRTETPTEKQKGSAYEYAKETGTGEEAMGIILSDSRSRDVSYGEIQSAMTSMEFVSRALLKQKQKYEQEEAVGEAVEEVEEVQVSLEQEQHNLQ